MVKSYGWVVAHEIILSALGLFRFSIPSPIPSPSPSRLTIFHSSRKIPVAECSGITITGDYCEVGAGAIQNPIIQR